MKPSPTPLYYPGTMIEVPRNGTLTSPPRLIHELSLLRHSLHVLAAPAPKTTLLDYLRLLSTITDSLCALAELVRTHEALLAAGEPLAGQLAASLKGIAAEFSQALDQA